VPFKDGLPANDAGIKILRETTDYSKHDERLQSFINDGFAPNLAGTVKMPTSVTVTGVGLHAQERGITIAEAQTFVDNAVIMCDQGNVNLYISTNGNAAVIDVNGFAATAYRKDEFYDWMNELLEGLKDEFREYN